MGLMHATFAVKGKGGCPICRNLTPEQRFERYEIAREHAALPPSGVCTPRGRIPRVLAPSSTDVAAARPVATNVNTRPGLPLRQDDWVTHDNEAAAPGMRSMRAARLHAHDVWTTAGYGTSAPVASARVTSSFDTGRLASSRPATAAAAKAQPTWSRLEGDYARPGSGVSTPAATARAREHRSYGTTTTRRNVFHAPAEAAGQEDVLELEVGSPLSDIVDPDDSGEHDISDLVIEPPTSLVWGDQPPLDEGLLRYPPPDLSYTDVDSLPTFGSYSQSMDPHGLDSCTMGPPSVTGSRSPQGSPTRKKPRKVGYSELVVRAAHRLGVPWTAPPLNPRTMFHPAPEPQHASETRRNPPLCPDVAAAVQDVWESPHLRGLQGPALNWSILDGPVAAGFTNLPPLEPILARHFRVPAGPRPPLPSPTLATSAKFVERGFRGAGQCVAFANTTALLQHYAHSLLVDARASPSPPPELLDELGAVTELTLLLAEGATRSAASGMAAAVQQQRLLWLSLADVPKESDRKAILNARITSDGLFGTSLSEMVANMDLRRKEEEAARQLLPRRGDSRPTSRPRSSRSKPKGPRTTPQGEQPLDQPPEPPVGGPEWSRPPPTAPSASAGAPGQTAGAVPKQRKPPTRRNRSKSGAASSRGRGRS